MGSLAQNSCLFIFLGSRAIFGCEIDTPERANKKLKVETLAGQGDVRSNNFCIHWGLQLPISFHQRFALLQFTGSSGPISGIGVTATASLMETM